METLNLKPVGARYRRRPAGRAAPATPASRRARAPPSWPPSSLATFAVRLRRDWRGEPAGRRSSPEQTRRPSLPPDHRGAKGFSRAAYTRGVVIVTCDGCEARHLLADRLGWFGAPGAVDDFLASPEAFRARAVAPLDGARAPGGVLELLAEDLDGWGGGEGG